MCIVSPLKEQLCTAWFRMLRHASDFQVSVEKEKEDWTMLQRNKENCNAHEINKFTQ